MSTADLSRLTAIVHTSERPGSVDRLIKSVGWLYPQLRVLVADDSSKPQPVAGADAVKVATGVGVSACRNTLLSRVRTPYFLLLEDGMELNRRSNVERLLELASSNQLDVAAGDVVRCQRRFGLFTSRKPEPAHAMFEFEADTMKLTPGHRPGIAGAHSCDSTHNFFVARTDKVRAIGGWDAQLQVDERIEFFFRACRYGLKVGVCPESIAWRWTEKSVTRKPARDFTSLAITKMGVSRMIDAEGRTHEAAAHSRAA
ncbi:MAG: hypothetical protein H0T51_19475 [Pirellulales bacterium]|nr:hypothetical protein [Pirellulales bacterium]